MPRDGSGIYHTPAGTDAVTDTTIESSKYNTNVHDVESDLNAPRPIVAGGTGASSADNALQSLSGEKAKQAVSDFNSAVFLPGSFYAATSAANSPVSAHAFAGIAYYNDASNLVLEARDITDAAHMVYYRIQTGGSWGAWTLDAGAVSTQAVRYDIAQSLTTNQRAQARANIGDLKKNYVLNGAMMISQENGATAGTVNSYYAVDQFFTGVSGTTGVGSFQQVASLTPGGSPNRLRATVTTADAAVAAGDVVYISSRLEGLRVADLAFGTATAKTTTVQFGVKAPAGTYCVVLLNSGANRSYVAEYTVAAGEANTDIVKSVVIPGDIAGTWLKDIGLGFEVRWGLMAGTTFQQAAGSWGTVNAMGSANQFNFMGTNGNVFELFDVGLYEGTAAPPFMVPDYAAELAACQRYLYRLVSGTGITLGMQQTYSTTQAGNAVIALPVPMRAVPTCTISAVAHFTGATMAGGGMTASVMNFFAGTTSQIFNGTATFPGGGLAPGGGASFLALASGGWVQASARL
jgi:hypothetical protein